MTLRMSHVRARVLRGTIVAATVALVMAVTAFPGQAAVITVTTTADENGSGTNCSLREAITAANTDSAFGGCPSGTGPDQITVPAGTYVIQLAGFDDANASGDLDLTGPAPTTIRGAGARTTIIDGAGIDSVFEIDAAATAEISDMTVQHGGSSDGGGIHNHGDLQLAHVSVVDNEGAYGGGVVNYPGTANLVMTDSLIARNLASDNSNGVAGGLSAENGATVDLTNVTISGNTATNDGGGIWHDSTSVVTLNNVTITGNTSDSIPGNASTASGGGIYIDTAGSLTMRNSILYGNTDATGGDAPDCAGPLTSGGENIVGTTTGCTFAPATGDLVGVDPRLAPLSDNGGPTQTHALLPDSPAIGRGGGDAAATDQRGVPRKDPDSGAYERALCGGIVVNIVGTNGKDTLRGTGASDGLLGLGGKDTLSGKGGKDGLCGGGGKDKLKGGGGKDRMKGQGGKDTCIGGGGKDKATCEREEKVP